MPQVIAESQIFPAKRAQLENLFRLYERVLNPKTDNAEYVIVTQALSVKIAGWIEIHEYIFLEWAGHYHVVLPKLQMYLFPIVISVGTPRCM